MARALKPARCARRPSRSIKSDANSGAPAVVAPGRRSDPHGPSKKRGSHRRCDERSLRPRPTARPASSLRVRLERPPPPGIERRPSEDSGGLRSRCVQPQAVRVDRPAGVADQRGSGAPRIQGEENATDPVGAFRKNGYGMSPGAQQRGHVDARGRVSGPVAARGGADSIHPQRIAAVDEEACDRPPGRRRERDRRQSGKVRRPALGAGGEPDPPRARKARPALAGPPQEQENALGDERDKKDADKNRCHPAPGKRDGGAARGALLTQGAAENTLFFPT